MDFTKSSQSFVRALKASSDPPSPGCPLKIEIAVQAWDNTSLYVPKKDEVIVEWILTKLLKDKDKESGSNPLLDTRFWTLLAKIVSPSKILPARSTKSWLVALLTRIPFAPTVVSFLKLLPSLDESCRQGLTTIVYRCLVTIWPFGVHKLSFDALSDCFGSILQVFRLCEADESLAQIGFFIASSFSTHVSNGSNRKKIYVSFLQNHLQPWMECVSARAKSNGTYGKLLDSIDTIGIEALFSLDILRQNREPQRANALFDRLGEIIVTFPLLVLGILPHIFNAFIQCIKKHRSALYVHGSNRSTGAVEGLLADGRSFFASLHSLLSKTSIEETWSARLALLSVVEKEKLFSMSRPEDEQSLKLARDLAIATLDDAWKTERVRVTVLALQILSTLFRINHDLVDQAVPRILPNLLLAVESNSSAVSYLSLLLDYHAKTRTMPAYIRNLFAALSQRPSCFPGGLRNIYQISFSGPLLHATHLDRLGKCVQGFLTPAQIIETVNIVLHLSRASWETFYNYNLQSTHDNGSSSIKSGTAANQRELNHPTDQINNSEDSAITFSLSAGIASVVLSYLPVQTAPDLRQEIQGLLDEVQMTLIHLSLDKMLKIIRKRDCSDEWAAQIVTIATIRLWYALDSNERPYFLSCQYDPEMLPKLLNASKDAGVLPELSLELFRILLRHCVGTQTDYLEQVLMSLLDFLDRNFDASDVGWPCPLSQLIQDKNGRSRAAWALFHFLIQRWLPVIDTVASEQSLERLVKVILGIRRHDTILSSVRGMPGNEYLVQALCSAQFWELPNLRTLFLTSLNSKTSLLDQIDARKCLLQACDIPFTFPFSKQEFRGIISTYEIILLVPVEYLTRACRTDFIRRALVADILANMLPVDSNNTLTYIEHSTTVLRVFLQRTLSYAGAIDPLIRLPRPVMETALNPPYPPPTLAGLMEYLLDNKLPLVHQNPEYTAVTLELIEAHLLILLKEETSTQAILKILNSFTKFDLLETFSMTEPCLHRIRQSGLMRLIDLLTRAFAHSDFPEVVLTAMFALQEHLFTSVLTWMRVLTEQTSFNVLLCQRGSLLAWCHVLALRRWLKLNRPAPPRFGKLLVTKILSSCGSDATAADIDLQLDDISAATLAILFEEIHTYPEVEHPLQLNIIVAACVALSGISNRIQFEAYVSKAARQISVADFSHILGFISDSLSNTDLSPKELTYLMRLLILLLHEAPQGTLKIIQASASRCLNSFVNHGTFSLGPVYLRLQVLNFVAKLCSDRPAALRSQDLGSIWSLLSKFLAGSEDHDDETSTAIFHDIVAIVNALIRLRRDLVVLTLPHLGVILRQLIMSIRGIRPHLGAKQIKLVANTLPKWICASTPLTAEEAKALARLLMTLTTKSIIRSHTSSTEPQTAESMAKPFSKHAAFVLEAYIDIMNDPLCVVPLELRKELQPGLFSLCDMLNEHSRDAMMVSVLDVGGKVNMKSLWKEYEKQRYVGKG